MPTNEHLAFWQWALERMGFPIAILIVLVYAGWRFVKYIQPFIEEIAKRHLALIDKADQMLTRNTEAAQQAAQAIQRIEAEIRSLQSEAKTARDEASKIVRLISENTAATREVAKEIGRIVNRRGDNPRDRRDD